MSIDRTTDLGEHKVFEGPEAEAALVRVALEREGIGVAIHASRPVRARLHGAVYVIDGAQLEAARAVVARFMKGADPSDAAILPPWTCFSCGEVIEGQFKTCWNCGTAK
jgi:hypothetical protein